MLACSQTYGLLRRGVQEAQLAKGDARNENLGAPAELCYGRDYAYPFIAVQMEHAISMNISESMLFNVHSVQGCWWLAPQQGSNAMLAPPGRPAPWWWAWQ